MDGPLPFEDQDFFEIDPVAYVDTLGDKGLAVYRREVAKRSDPADVPAGRSPSLQRVYGDFPSFAAKYAAQRLAIIDRDIDRIAELQGGDLTLPHQFAQVAEAMVELGLPDDALRWARRGISETTGWQVAKLYDLAAKLLADAGDLDAVVALRRDHHEREPSAATYLALQKAAHTSDTWDAECTRARLVLREQSPNAYIDVLLIDGEPDEAWSVAMTSGEVGSDSRWFSLAQAREPTEPSDAMAVYLRLADEALEVTDKRAYRSAIQYLKAARRAATAAEALPAFAIHLAGLRERNRRRPSFMAKLDKAGLR